MLNKYIIVMIKNNNQTIYIYHMLVCLTIYNVHNVGFAVYAV